MYLLAGDEDFLKEEWLRKTRHSLFNNDDDSVDFSVFYATDADITQVVATARTGPFLAKKRLLVIRNAQDLKSAPQQGAILAYLKNPSLSTILIIEASVKEKDLLRSTFLSAVRKLAEPVMFRKLYDAELAHWMTRRFQAAGKKVSPVALELLKDLKGNDLQALSQEIEKLSVHAGDAPAIRVEDVQELVGRDVTAGVYDIIDAISQDDPKRALVLGLDLPKSDLGNIIGLFCWNLRRLLIVRECLKEGWPPAKIGERLDLRKFQLDRFIPQAQRLRSSWIKKALTDLAALDAKMKTSGLQDTMIGWDMLLVSLTAGPKTPKAGL